MKSPSVSRSGSWLWTSAVVPPLAVLSAPFIPDAAADLMAAMRTDDAAWPADAATALAALPPGHAFAVPEVTFRKITDEETAEWAERFAGIRG